MKTIISFFTIILTSFLALNAQPLPNAKPPQKADVCQQVQGTFLVEVIRTREITAVNYNKICPQIAALRSENEPTYLSISPTVRVKILSKNEISKKQFRLIDKDKTVVFVSKF